MIRDTMHINCSDCNKPFEVYKQDQEILQQLSPIIWETLYLLDIPKQCPECRQKQRISFRNENRLYKSKCSASGKAIISLYSPDKNLSVYYHEKVNFFTQFQTILSSVPKISLYWFSNQNSEYTNDCTHCKNCYLLSSSDYSEDCYYGLMQNSKNSMDCFDSAYLENCYECTDCDHRHNVQFALNSQNCQDSQYLFNCNNCSDCFMSHNLHNKKYYIRNIPYTKEEYLERIKKETSIQDTEFAKMIASAPKQANKIHTSIQCSWNSITNSKDCFHCFDISMTENSRYVYYGSLGTKDCMDTAMVSINSSQCYNSQCCLDNCHKLIACNYCVNVQESYYMDNCKNCKNCFWCVWLKDKQYYILNKPYSKSEYEKTITKIITQLKREWVWGEFFPKYFSPFWYNESAAQNYTPLTKENAESLWYNWSDYILQAQKVEKIIPADSLPHDINNIPNDILNWAIKCSKTQKVFRILSQELEFYRKFQLRVPIIHPDERQISRLSRKNARQLHKRTCSWCKKNLTSVYKKDIIYCDDCYREKII